MHAIVVATTVGTEEQANLIAREIVARRQAACVNIVPGIRSIYRWKGKICKDGELLLVVKTLAGEFEATCVVELHETFNRARVARPDIAWTTDGVHPTSAGHMLIAHSWLTATGLL